MTGVVVKVASYGAFVRMGEELSIKGLLHIRNVTQLKVEDLNVSALVQSDHPNHQAKQNCMSGPTCLIIENG